MSERLDDEEKEELLESFQFFAKGRPVLAGKDVAALMRYLGVIMTDAEVMTMIREAGGAETLDQNQFMNWMGRKMTSSLTADDLVMAFKVFDKDGSGLISVPELRFVMCCLGDKLDDEIVDSMLDTADPSGTGHIKYEPFIRQMMAKGNF